VTNRDNVRFLGFIKLAEGVRYRHAMTALYASLISIGILNFMHFARPFLLLDVVGLEPDFIGRFTGYLNTWIELLAMALTMFVGVWADRLGRRMLYALAVLLVGAGFFGMAIVQTQFDYILYSTVMGIGSALTGTLLGLLMVDYPAEQSRGMWTGINAMLNGVGIVAVSLGVTKLPAFLEARGMTDVAAMDTTLLGMGFWCLLSAAILRMGLITGLTKRQTEEHVPAFVMLKEGVIAGRSNLRVMLAYFCFVVSRADLVVVATYLTLWVQDYARGAGVSPTEAIAKAGLLFGLIQGTALIWGPIYGYLLDKLDRVLCIIVALVIAGISYVVLGLSPNPLSNEIIPTCVVVGVGQISVLLGTQSLIGQVAPVDRRGTVMGIATFCGTVGIFVTTFSSGILYDLWMPSAPLVVFGLLNLAIALPAVWVWRRTDGTVLLSTQI
jgi:MFS family permease